MLQQRLKFLKFSHYKIYTRKRGYKEKIVFDLYQCSCGKKKIARRSCVNSPNQNSTWSCGCLRSESARRLCNEGLNRHGKGSPGRPAHNKGKVEILEDGRKRYVTEQELREIHYGIS